MAMLLVKHAHFLDDGRWTPPPHDLSRRRAIEHVNRAERAGPCAAPAREQRDGAAAEHGRTLPSTAVRVRNVVEIVKQMAWRRGGCRAGVPKGDAFHVMPVE